MTTHSGLSATASVAVKYGATGIKNELWNGLTCPAGIACALILWTVASCPSLSAQERQPDDGVSRSPAAEIRFIAAGIENARSVVRCARANVSRYQLTPVEIFDDLRSSDPSSQGMNLPTATEEKVTTARWYFQRPRWLLTVETDAKDPSILRSQTLAVNGSQASILQEYDESGNHPKKAKSDDTRYAMGAIVPAQDTVKDGIGQAGFEYLDPRAYAYFLFPGGRTLEQVLLKSDPAAVIRGEEIIGNSRCTKIEVWLTRNRQGFLWIDVDHGFLLRRIEENIRRGDKMLLSRHVEVPQIVSSNDIWFPALVEERRLFYLQHVLNPQQELRPVVILNRITITGFKTDCDLPGDELSIRWPVGTRIQDTINQRQLIVAAVGRGTLSQLNVQRRLRKQVELTGVPLRKEELIAVNQQRKTEQLPELQEALLVALELEDVTELERLEKKPST
jgi:hypothetical protein